MPSLWWRIKPYHWLNLLRSLLCLVYIPSPSNPNTPTHLPTTFTINKLLSPNHKALIINQWPYQNLTCRRDRCKNAKGPSCRYAKVPRSRRLPCVSYRRARARVCSKRRRHTRDRLPRRGVLFPFSVGRVPQPAAVCNSAGKWSNNGRCADDQALMRCEWKSARRGERANHKFGGASRSLPAQGESAERCVSQWMLMLRCCIVVVYSCAVCPLCAPHSTRLARRRGNDFICVRCRCRWCWPLRRPRFLERLLGTYIR